MNDNLKELTFLDFETTGLTENCAVSLAIIHRVNGKIKFAKYYLINPQAEIEYGAYRIHGIKEKTIQDKPTFAEIWEEIKPYISNQILIGHNVQYEARVLKKEIARYGLDCQPFQTICTCNNTKKAVNKTEIENYKLDTVCEYFGIKFSDHHDARADTEGCMKIFDVIKTMRVLDIKKIEI